MKIDRTVVGRSNEPIVNLKGHADLPDGDFADIRISLEGAEISERQHDGTFFIRALHENGTDFEHDSATVAYFEGAGLKFRHMYGNVVRFSAYIYRAKMYRKNDVLTPGAMMHHDQDNDTIEVCEDTEYYHPEGSGWPAGHLLMPYMPPDYKMPGFVAEITVIFGDRS